MQRGERRGSEDGTGERWMRAGGRGGRHAEGGRSSGLETTTSCSRRLRLGGAGDREGSPTACGS